MSKPTVKPEAVTVKQPRQYQIRVTSAVALIRSGPGDQHEIVTQVPHGSIYTIVDEQHGWGKLGSGAGWINLVYTEHI